MTADEQRARANERSNQIVHFARVGQTGPNLRTLLDEYAAFENGGGLLTRGGRQRWFNNPCPVREGARLLVHMDWFSVDAAAILARGINGDDSVRKLKRGAPSDHRLVVDHAVPVAVVAKLIAADNSLWSLDTMRPFIKAHYKRGVLTTAEDRVLTEAKLRQSMPAGWQPGDDPFARYNAVGLRRFADRLAA